MIHHIVRFSIQQRLFVLIAAVLLVGAGLYNAARLPIDAQPDITNKQVQVNTTAPALAPQEVERQITFPLEVALAGLPHLKETRSVSQFGLSQVTVIFDDKTDIYFARQLVLERLQEARESLPPGAGLPEMGPVSTGLGEIYTVIVESDQTLMEKRTLLDTLVRPQLRTVPGIIEVNAWGGSEKQFQALVDPARLAAHGLTIRDVQQALEENNSNAGGAYLQRGDEQQLVRGVGVIRNEDDIRNIVITAKDGTPIHVHDVATVTTGPAIRQGALTMDGEGEAVAAVTMLLLGENGRVVVERVKDRVAEIQKTLPAGTRLIGYMDRSELINRTLHTAVQNLVEGGLLVFIVLFLFLLQWRAGLIVSSAIPLSMLIAIIGMRRFDVSANLMSLGAIDFGLIVDGAVIIVENAVRRLAGERRILGRDLTQEERNEVIESAAEEVLKPAVFGMGIITAAYLPVLSLAGIEGKMFRPMGLTVVMALSGALLLSLTVVPALCATFLRVREEKHNRALDSLADAYAPALRWAMRNRGLTATAAAAFFLGCAALFPLLGSEFIPDLDEGALAIGVSYPPSMSLEAAIERAGVLERTLKQGFPDEVDRITTRIGRAEVATDPMLVSQHDVIISLKPKKGWTKAKDRYELVAAMSHALEDVPGMGASFSQPIKFRMNELIEGLGIRSDLGIKLYGDDLDVLADVGAEIGRAVRSVPGATEVAVETTEGLPVLNMTIRRDEIARYRINVADVQHVIETAVGGAEAGEVVVGNQRIALVVRFAEAYRRNPDDIGRILVSAPSGARVPLAQLADIESVEGPVQIGRENGQRRVIIQSNVRGRDLGRFVADVERAVDRQVRLPVGYHVEYAGTYEHLESGRNRLAVVVPITFAIIFLLLFTTFGSLKQAALVFTGIPFAITGGILALFFRTMHFSMSAGIGFIALFGVAVLNGVVLVTFINHLREDGLPLWEAVEQGALTRLRPVLMTASVASIGFIPMALARGPGAEVQRPLATVVIGGLITSTLLTLFVLPTLYAWFERDPAASVP